MGAADFNTGAELRGTNEEIFAMLMVARSYGKEKRAQYQEKRNCPYFMSVYVNEGDEFHLRKNLLNLSDEDLMEFIASRNGVVSFEASGPYGVFNGLDSVDVFHEMAEAAPHAQISGGMGGFSPGGDEYANFELKDGLMVCKYAHPHWDEDFEDDEEFDEDWDDEDDFEDMEEPEWDEEIVYDPIAKKNVKK